MPCVAVLFFLLTLSCLPLVVGIRAQEHLGVGFINLELFCFLACLGKRRIIELLLHKQIGQLKFSAVLPNTPRSKPVKPASVIR